ncbi:hypothetical protein NAL19_2721 [Pectobacterium sp. F1-1]|uniref:SDR family oxidoreductase n=1 Tax=Pectobacterium sp. F1-1 TaxID=2949614 RepID=UPI0021D7B64E|nr:SDR family oxidoreductase [Pectobacterium sp. F1-1]UYA60824.1 hypothetical protein NAL19_2721 [Pectobacterium sp. F1-1]
MNNFTRMTENMHHPQEPPDSRPVALIAGATGGVGQQCTFDLIRAGYRVIALSRSDNNLNELSRKALSAGPADRLKTFRVDVTGALAGQRVRHKVELELGRLDLLLLSAGITSNKSTGLTETEVNEVISSNLTGPMLLIDELIPLLLKAENPYVVSVASRAGKTGFSDKGLYGASKAGLLLYVQSLASIPALQKIRFTSLCPGWINTEMARTGGCQLPAKNLLQPEDISSLLLWLTATSPRVRINEIIIEPAQVNR